MSRRVVAMAGQSMARARSLTEFQEAFPDEAGCAAFLFERRWQGGFVCPRCGGERVAALKSRAHTYECLDCGSSDLDHGRQRDASLQAPADGLVLGRTSDVDALQRDVGAAVGVSTRPHLQDRLVADTEAAAIDGRSGQGTP